jgi:hypothetical protein
MVVVGIGIKSVCIQIADVNTRRLFGIGSLLGIAKVLGTVRAVGSGMRVDSGALQNRGRGLSRMGYHRARKA